LDGASTEKLAAIGHSDSVHLFSLSLRWNCKATSHKSQHCNRII
jgi:hypothetical protein